MFKILQQFARNQSTNTVAQAVCNRNPRSLERLRIGHKPTGYHLEKKGREFWYKLVIEKQSRYITAKVIHHTGSTVVHASSSEWCIGKHLYRPADTAAYINLGRVMAQRCLESGITEMLSGVEATSSKRAAFLKHFEEGGVSLCEPPKYNHYTPWSREPMEKSWTVHVD